MWALVGLDVHSQTRYSVEAPNQWVVPSSKGLNWKVSLYTQYTRPSARMQLVDTADAVAMRIAGSCWVMLNDHMISQETKKGMSMKP